MLITFIVSIMSVLNIFFEISYDKLPQTSLNVTSIQVKLQVDDRSQKGDLSLVGPTVAHCIPHTFANSIHV